jgi:hypothetical protein
VTDQVQTPPFEETALPVAVDVSSLEPDVAAPPPPPPPPVRVEPAWLRLAYAFEFLLALLVGIVLWTQIGGQGHLDLMPWYIKLACVNLLAWCTVRLTAAMVEQPKAWNRASRLWLVSVLLVSFAMGAVTYYVHLHEASESDTDETSTTSVRNWSPGQPHWFS